MLIIIIGIFKQSFFFGYYVVFTENFIENFCENKDKPELECDGKCFLSDLIEKKNSDSVEIPPYIEKQLVLFFQESQLHHFAPIETTISLFNYANLYQFDYLSFSFKPPSA